MPASPPNIVLCMMDDHRHDALGCAGHPVVRTPFLDRLAEEGTRFTNAYLPGSLSGAVCMPSRAMLHSGRTLFHLHDHGSDIPADQPILGELLQQRGYHTFHTGKWHNGKPAFNRGFKDGDLIFFGGMGDPWNLPFFRYDPTGEYAGTLPIIREPKHDNTVEHRPGDVLMPGEHATDLICDRAARFIDDYEKAEPFFLSVALLAPHDPRTAPPAYHEGYHPEDMPLPDNFLAQSPVDTGALRGRDETLAAIPRQPGEVREHLADYYAMISHLDDGLSRIMAALEQRGMRENTLFVFVSDHGLSMGSHGLMGKQSVYEHDVRVPMIVSGPGIPVGAVREDPVWHLDLNPFFCRVGGAEVPDTCEGRDLMPERAAPEQPRSVDEMYFAYGQRVRGVREGPWKLIEYAHPEGDRTWQLFNLDDDPLEMRNRASEPGQAERIERMRRHRRDLSSKVGETVDAFRA